MMKHVTGIGATGLMFLAVLSYPGVAAAHGVVNGEDDPCLRQVGERIVHFNAYQPQYQLKDQYCTDIPQEGDTVLAVLTESVPLNGFTLDKGAEVHGRVFTSVPAKRVSGRARLVFGFESVMEGGEKLSISTEAIDTSGKSTGSQDKKIIGGGALGGLIVGAIKDGKKGAAIGTVIGAAAGGGAVLIMKGHEVEIPRGAQITVVVTN